MIYLVIILWLLGAAGEWMEEDENQQDWKLLDRVGVALL